MSDLTSEQFAELLLLDALETAGSAPAMEVDANTSDAELDAFLFGPD